MKGFSLFADVFSIFVLIAVVMLMSVLLWTFIVVYNVEKNLNMITPRTVDLTMFFNPIKYDTTLMTFLESENNGIAVKKILNAVAIQEKTNVWLDGKDIDASAISDTFLSSRIKGPFIFKIVLPSKEIIIVEKNVPSVPETPTHMQETSTKIFLLDGSSAELKLLVYVS